MSIEVKLNNAGQLSLSGALDNSCGVNAVSEKESAGGISSFSVPVKDPSPSFDWSGFFPLLGLFGSLVKRTHGVALEPSQMTMSELIERATILEEAAFGQPARQSRRMVSMMFEKMQLQAEIVFRLFNEVSQRTATNDEDLDAPNVREIVAGDADIQSRLAEGSAVLANMFYSFHFLSKALNFINEIKTDGGFDENRRDVLAFQEACVVLAASVYNMSFDKDFLRYFKWEVSRLVINLSRSPEVSDVERAIQIFSAYSHLFAPRCALTTFEGLGRRLLALNREAVLSDIRIRLVSQNQNESALKSLMYAEEANLDAVICADALPHANKIIFNDGERPPEYFLYSPSLGVDVPVSGNGKIAADPALPPIKLGASIYKMPSQIELRVQRLFLEDKAEPLRELDGLRLRLKAIQVLMEKLERK